MKVFVNIKEGNQNFEMALSFIEDKVELPARQAYKSVDRLEKFDNIIQNSRFLWSCYLNQKLIEKTDISPEDVYELLRESETLKEHNIEVRVPDIIVPTSKFQINITNTRKGKMIFKLAVDGIELSPEVIQQIKTDLKDTIFLSGKWCAVDSNLIVALSDNELDIIQTLQALHQTKDIFLTDNITIKNIANTGDPIGYHCDITATLRQYQEKALELLVQALNDNRNILLADDMGLGKTITIISLLNVLFNSNRSPNLVIVPKTLIYNWQDELQRFSPNIPFCIVSNEILPDYNTYLTTYGHVLNNPEMYAETHWNLIVLDEAQQIKNSNTAQSNIICSLLSNHKIAMTGTPIENSVMELWSLFQFLDKSLLGKEDNFKQLVKDAKSYNWLQALLDPYVIRRVKTDESLGLNLPAKLEQVLYCELTDEQKVLYNAVVEQFEHDVKLSKRLKKRVSVFQYIHLLKLLCSDYTAIIPDDNTSDTTGKLKALIAYLKGIGKDKFILFTQYRIVADNLNNALSKFYGTQGLVIDGTLSAKRRTKIASQFQQGEFPYIILTLKAGNSGLTLTEANHVIHYDRWWNPSVENQATDRAYRIGQTKDVHVVKMVTKGTLEERIHEILSDKIELFDKIITPLNMSNEEVLDFIKFQKE